MTSPVDDPNASRWLTLSALCDGEASAGETEACLARWREDPALRERWHGYQWIGDVMRSDDLASDAGHDQAFLLALRARLATEPVVLAPTRPAEQPAEPLTQPRAQAVGGGVRRQRWAAPAAMAAGVMVVAGALVVMQGTTALTGPAGGGAGAPLAVAAVDAEPAAAASAAGATGGAMLRNPELDRYLAAHRQFAQGPALTTPSGVRQVAVTPEGR